MTMSCWLDAKAKTGHCDYKKSPGCIILLGLTTGMKAAIKGQKQSYIDSRVILEAAVTAPLSGDEYR